MHCAASWNCHHFTYLCWQTFSLPENEAINLWVWAEWSLISNVERNFAERGQWFSMSPLELVHRYLKRMSIPSFAIKDTKKTPLNTTFSLNPSCLTSWLQVSGTIGYLTVKDFTDGWSSKRDALGEPRKPCLEMAPWAPSSVLFLLFLLPPASLSSSPSFFYYWRCWHCSYLREIKKNPVWYGR